MARARWTLAIILTAEHEWMRRLAESYKELIPGVVVEDPGGDIDAAIRIIDSCPARGIGTLICYPIEPPRLIHSLRRFKETGAVLIGQGGHVPLADVVVCTSDEDIGRIAAEEFRSWWKEHRPGRRADILVLDSPQYWETQKRATSFIDTLGQFADIEVGTIRSIDCAGSQVRAKETCIQVLREQPGVGFIFGINDPCAVGALQASRDVARADIAVGGVDADSIAVEELERPVQRGEGGFIFTVEISPILYAVAIADEASKLSRKIATSTRVTVPVRIIRRGGHY